MRAGGREERVRDGGREIILVLWAHCCAPPSLPLLCPPSMPSSFCHRVSLSFCHCMLLSRVGIRSCSFWGVHFVVGIGCVSRLPCQPVATWLWLSCRLVWSRVTWCGHRIAWWWWYGCRVAWGVTVVWIGGGVIFAWWGCSCWGLWVPSSGRCECFWAPSFHFSEIAEGGVT